jgi:hypothetical protein
MAILKFDKNQSGEILLENPEFSKVFIETGTYHGETLANAAKAFHKCYSIEYDQELYLKAFKKFDNIPSVKILHGSSPDVLKHIIDPDKSTIFWLDAHFMSSDHSDVFDQKYGQCPLLHELEVIFSFNWKYSPSIFVDDAYLFSDYFWDLPVSDLDKDRTSFARLKNGMGVKRLGLQQKHWPKIEEIRKIVPEQYKMYIKNEILLLIK